MKRKRHSTEQIIGKLREAEAGLAAGEDLPSVCKRLEVSEQTYYRWRNQFSGMQGPEIKRLKELEKENERLKRAVADLTLDNQILKEVAKGNF